MTSQVLTQPHWSRDTEIVHLGRESSIASHSVNPPLVRASTTIFQSLSEFKKSYSGICFEAPRYGRSGTSTNFELQKAMASISNAETCLAMPSGLSAIAAVVGAHSEVGKKILVQDGVYGPSRTFCEVQHTAEHCKVDFFSSLEELKEKIGHETSLVFVEVPTSLTMRMVDVPAVCAVAHSYGVPVACDSTWGTPIFFDAHGLGIDISIHAATKYINGHSDVMLGLVTGSYDALATTRSWCDRFGTHVSADSCWLALRGLRTLSVRMRKHYSSALHVSTWLLAQPEVRNVYFPALPSDPGHELWKQQFSGAPGPFTIELKRCDEQSFERFINSLKLFGLGTSWGGFESLVMPAIPHHRRALPVQPDDGRMVRLHIGLENPEDLCLDLRGALDQL